MLAIALLGREGLYRLGELTADSNSSQDFPRTDQWSCDRSRGMAYLELHQGKTNKWRKAIRVVHPLGNEESAAELVESLLANRSRVLPSDPLFQERKGRPITRKAFCQWLVLNLEAVGIDSTGYKGHSLRIGGATERVRPRYQGNGALDFQLLSTIPAN